MIPGHLWQDVQRCNHDRSNRAGGGDWPASAKRRWLEPVVPRGRSWERIRALAGPRSEDMDNDMHIFITPGTGSAETRLSAFDAALDDAGIANLNLITLSSVIPPGAKIRCGRPDEVLETQGAQWGDRLYCVLAECRVTDPGTEAWAGIGWWQGDDGRGLFVEEHGASEHDLRAELTASIQGCVAHRDRSLDDGDWGLVVQGMTCVDKPVCALVAAVYQTEGWGRPGTACARHTPPTGQLAGPTACGDREPVRTARRSPDSSA